MIWQQGEKGKAKSEFNDGVKSMIVPKIPFPWYFFTNTQTHSRANFIFVCFAPLVMWYRVWVFFRTVKCGNSLSVWERAKLFDWAHQLWRSLTLWWDYPRPLPTPLFNDLSQSASRLCAGILLTPPSDDISHVPPPTNVTNRASPNKEE